MKLFKNLFWAIVLLSIPLSGMEEREKPKEEQMTRMIQGMRSLEIFAHSSLKLKHLIRLQDLFPELANACREKHISQEIKLVQDIFEIDDAQERAKQLSNIPLKIQCELAYYFLNIVIQGIQPQDDKAKRSFINNFIDNADIKNLHLLRVQLIRLYITCYRKKLLVRGLFELDTKTSGKNIDESVWLRQLLDKCTEKISIAIQATNEAEPKPCLEEEFTEYANLLDQANWENYSLKDLEKNKINRDSFFKYIFTFHIPSKEFTDKQLYNENCEAMIEYIDNILSKCKSDINVLELMRYLFEIYPEMTHLLFLIDSRIHAKYIFRINPHLPFLDEKFHSTILCPKLYLMYRLKNILFHHQINILSELLVNSKIEECSDKILELYDNFSNKRLVKTLIEYVLKAIAAAKEDSASKYNLLNNFAKSLIICLPKIELSYCTLSMAYKYSIKLLKDIRKDNKEVDDESLREILKQAFLRK